MMAALLFERSTKQQIPLYVCAKMNGACYMELNVVCFQRVARTVIASTVSVGKMALNKHKIILKLIAYQG